MDPELCYRPFPMGYQEAWENHELPFVDAVTCEEMSSQVDMARGFGEQVAKILAAPPKRKRSPELLVAFLRSMPEQLRISLGQIKPEQLDHNSAAKAIYHASLGMSYGVSAESVVELGYDAAKTAFCAAQSLCLALGYEDIARSLVETVSPDIKFSRGELAGGKKGELALSVSGPYNELFVNAMRGPGANVRAYQVGGGWVRFFKAENLPNIINILMAIWLDAFVLGPDGNLSVLPAKQFVEVPFPINPLPANGNIRATGEMPPEPVMRIGDFANYKGKDYVVVDAAPQFPQRVGFRALGKPDGPADFYTVLQDLANVKMLNGREAVHRLQAVSYTHLTLPTIYSV